jgi:Uma2 family endonuclease
MKAVMSTVPEHILAWRRKTGADQWDEMWEGVLHMAPSPNRDHQDIEGALEAWLRQYWGKPNRCGVYHQINIAEPGTWPNNYRIPDLVLLSRARKVIDRNEYFEGGPDAVVEVHSPGDEAYEKLDFYANVGVREVWIIDRDSRRPEIFVRSGDRFVERPAGREGWVESEVAGAEMRATADGALEIRMIGRDDTLAQLP